MGFTYEHDLHHRSRRLWSWRDQWGNETQWNIYLGKQLASADPDELWALLTA
jgi:acyl-CoA dehydrogenase